MTQSELDLAVAAARRNSGYAVDGEHLPASEATR